MDRVDCIVVGAGVVGLAVARRLALSGRETLLLERDDTHGTQTSSRNSEVVHAGLYYAPGSLKARLCVEGRGLLYRYCGERGVPHRRCGKLVVATSDGEEATLRGYLERAARNGVTDLEWHSSAEAARLEPALRCVAALWSPSTGIVDSHALMLALLADLQAAGGTIACRAEVVGVTLGRDAHRVCVRQDGEVTEIRADIVVNAAGLDAQGVAQHIEGLDAATIPRRHLAKGHYFSLQGPAPFTRLVYPVADRGGLGVHLTLDLAGRARFGPDVEWIETIDYTPDEGRRGAFAAAIRRYFPGLDESKLLPAYTGIRPKLGGRGAPEADFVIQGAAAHGWRGLVNLYGIESPGLTACLAIADEVAAVLGRDATDRQPV